MDPLENLGLQAPEVEPEIPQEDASSSDDGQATDPQGAGKPPRRQNGKERPDKNFAKEALRRTQKLEDRIDLLMQQNQQLLSQLSASNQNGNQEEHQVTTTELVTLAQNQDWEGYAKALDLKISQEARRQAGIHVSQDRLRSEADSLRDFMSEELGLSEEDTDWAVALKEEGKRIKRRFPSLPDDSLSAVAGLSLGRKAARGEMEFPDLREAVARSQENLPSAGVQPPEKPQAEIPVNFDAPGRGLPREVQDQLRGGPLAEYLEKSSNPRIEKMRRDGITRLIKNLKLESARAKVRSEWFGE